MPILLLFLLVAACQPVDEFAPPFALGPRASAGLTAAAVLLPLAAAFALRTWVVRALRRDPNARANVAPRYGRLRYALSFVNLGAVVLAVFGLGWRVTVWQSLTVTLFGTHDLAPLAELVVTLPYFLIAFGCWLIYYDADRALARRPADDPGPVRFWSRGGYFLHHFRQLAFLLGLPVGLLAAQQSLIRFAPETAATAWVRLGSVAAVVGLILFLPLVIRPVLGLRPLPPGPDRARAEALARRLRFRYADLLVWPTHGFIANAMIAGLVPRARYVVFTDRLLDEMPADELDAIFGHEVGHARHGHLWYYMLFITLSLAVLAGLAEYLRQRLVADSATLAALRPYAEWVALVPTAAGFAYLFVAFGYLSRRCERQADVFGCRAVSCGDPACTGHDDTTVYPDRGAGLCPTGIRTFARALDRVYHMNGQDAPPADGRRTAGGVMRELVAWLRAWQHSTIPRRVNFLLSLIDDPGRERRFQRGVTRLRWGLMLGLAAALVLLGEAAGWRQLLAVM